MENSSSSFETLRQSILSGNPEKTQEQHSKNKLTARERIERLLDPASFVETGMFIAHRANGFGMEKNRTYTDGVITGWGKIDGRLVYIFAQDFTFMGGSVGEAHGKKIAHLLDLAIQNGAPVIGLNDSGGARIQEGVDSLAGYGEIFMRNVRASGVIPQISVILGPCAGGAVYSPAVTDFIFMVEQTAHMFITGPDVVQAVTHQAVTAEALGGSVVHREQSGVAHFTTPDEESLLQTIRWLFTYLPSNNLTPPPWQSSGDKAGRLTPELAALVPEDPQQPYDIHLIIETIVDNAEFLEVQSQFAQNLVVGFARLDGYPVGIIANQADILAGGLDINASDKGARFIRFCDAFHIPLITLVDTPGFVPGIDQEHNGIIRHGAKLLYAFAEATVPKISLILRKAYGGAYIVMSSKHLGGDLNFAWPTSEIAVMGPQGAIKIAYRKELEAAEDKNARQAELIEQYRRELATPLVAASHGYLDDIFEPALTRIRLIQGLEALRDKRQPTPNRKHGNIPL